MCDAVGRPGRLTLCTGTNINSGALPPATNVSVSKVFPPAPYTIRLVLLPQ
jgi:hypothetical protein